jgi:hypothetical protein
MVQPIAPLLENQTVSTLILEDSWSWDKSLVRTLFSEELADQILQVPISRHGGDNFVSWPYTRFGCYTVKSGYNLARSLKFIDQRSLSGGGMSSETEGDSKLWKTL